jgi:hypothetical protein
MATLFILPFIFSFPVVEWACFIGKAIFGIVCYFYIK